MSAGTVLLVAGAIVLLLLLGRRPPPPGDGGDGGDVLEDMILHDEVLPGDEHDIGSGGG